MSSASDQVAFAESVEDQSNVNLFESKKWTYVTDSTSNGGQFSGQLQFDLNTLSSQNQWTDLSQGYIQFPVKLTIKNNTALAPAPTVNAACIKNGFHQFVDSVQVILGGCTIQSSQIYTSIDTTYKMLSEFSSDELNKWGPSLGLALDDYTPPVTTVTTTSSLDNAALVTAGTGFNMGLLDINPGVKQRLNMLNNTTASTGLGANILTSNAILLGKGNVQTGTSATSDTDVYVQFALATIRLKDISDSIAKLPLIKGMKGFIYVNYNAGTSVLTNSGASSAFSAVTSSTTTYGRCMPAMFNGGGFAFNGTGTAPVTFTAEISAVKSTVLTTAGPTQQNATLVVPYYVGTPEIDRALSTKKTIRYNERFVTQFNIDKSGNYNGTLSPGISNPNRLILYPYLTGAGDSGNSGFLANPLLSPVDTAPATTSPFAALKDLQVYVGNVPMFQAPITMDYATYLNEVAQQGIDGGLVSQTSSGLLNQRMWNQLYRYYTVDIGRRMNSSDGCSKSVQLSCTNATRCPMTVIAIIWYERVITVDTASGAIMQSM